MEEDFNLGSSLESRVWWNFIDEDLRELLKESLLLMETAEKWKEDLPSGSQEFHDYAFIVFPAAKAYEGFLKKLFLDLGFISQEDYAGKRFRVGKALNPALEKEIREREGVYDKLVNFCFGKELADRLWETWKMARNLIFHWFPNEKNAISINQAKERIVMVLETMDSVFKECKINKGSK
jgi:hypothetical protein